MTLGNDNGTDGQTDRRTDRVRRNMRPPPREEGRIITQPKKFKSTTHTSTEIWAGDRQSMVKDIRPRNGAGLFLQHLTARSQYGATWVGLIAYLTSYSVLTMRPISYSLRDKERYL